MAPTLVWLAADPSTMGAISRGRCTRTTWWLVTGSHQSTRSISTVSTSQQRASNSSIPKNTAPDAWTRTTRLLKNFKPIQPDNQNQLLDLLRRFRGQIRPSEMKANEFSQSSLCKPWAIKQPKNITESKQLGCHNVNLNDDFDTSLTSRSNTRKNLHRHQAPSGSGSSLLISHNGPAHINWIEFAIIAPWKIF